MTEQLWNRAVIVEINGVSTQYIRNTREAAWYLLDDWAGEKGPSYQRAVVGCAKALAGALPDPAARILFVAAAREVQLTVNLSNDIREFDLFVADLAEASNEAMFEGLLVRHH